MWLLERVNSRASFLAFATSSLVAAALAVGCGSSHPSGGGTPQDDAAAGDDGGAPGDDASGGDGSTPTGDAAPIHPIDAGPPPQLTSAVKIIVEPGDNGSALLAAIQGARTSVHMTMYLLTSSSILNALVAQKNAGHDVKVLLNKTFPMGAGSNSSVYTQLANAGVNVHYAPSGFTYTHEKTVIIDGATAWIMTMNATQSSAADNREYLAIDTDATDVQEAEAIFAADFANMAYSPSGKLVVAPDNARGKLVALIVSSKSTVDVEAEEMSDPAIVNALADAGDRGVNVRVVLASGSSSTSQAMAVATLKQHRVKVVSVNVPYIHAKSIVVDGTSAYVGSENFSTGSLQYNRELGVLFDTAAEVQKVLTATSADFAHGTAL